MAKINFTSTIVVFAKVPGKGMAKSRIAATHGQEKAAEVYQELLDITADIVSGFRYHIAYTGSDNPGTLKDIFPNAHSFFNQEGKTLGDRLFNAFTYLFNEGFESVLAIGTDCPYLSKNDLSIAIAKLNYGIDTVIGPAKDGGYYLIGCNKNSIDVFSAKKWSSSGLFEETIDIIKSNNLSYFLLRTLSDIDYMEDYLLWKES